MLCSCDGPPHPYNPSWCVSGPVPRPKNWVEGTGGSNQNTTIIGNVYTNNSSK